MSRAGVSLIIACVWGGVMQPSPVGKGMGPYVCAEEILLVNCGGNVVEDGLVDVSFDGVLLLLIWRGAIVSALVFLVEKVCFV